MPGARMHRAASLSRRELLAALLGAPLAAEACRFLPSRRIDGALRGASMDVGHRLRDATVEAAPRGEPLRVGVAIVGAGPSGLSAAYRLERRGLPDYAVFELEQVAGGTSAYGKDGVVPYPCGAHYVPLPTADNPELVRLLDEMGELEHRADGSVRAVETALVREPVERLFVDGAWRAGLFPVHGASSADLAELDRFTREIDDWVERRDAAGRRAFTVPVSRCSPDAAFTELDRLSAAEYLERRGYRSPRLGCTSSMPAGTTTGSPPSRRARGRCCSISRRASPRAVRRRRRS
jgi:hypothetical protein